MLLSFVVLNILTICYAMPYAFGPKNVITVPPNCPPGQEWINGACRDIWFKAVTAPSPVRWESSDVSAANLITVPPNCPPGQQYINGKCRDVWRGVDNSNSLLFIQQLQKVWNDYIRKIQQTRVEVIENSNVVNGSPRNIINVPNQCPIGFKPDALGICRPIL